MSPPNMNPGSPDNWLLRAKSNLIRARNLPDEAGFFLEDACFDAQQLVEKSLKAVLVHLDVHFPLTHNIGRLLSLVRQHVDEIPEWILKAAKLTDYAVEARYPPSLESVTQEECQEALKIAEDLHAWASKIIGRDD